MILFGISDCVNESTGIKSQDTTLCFELEFSGIENAYIGGFPILRRLVFAHLHEETDERPNETQLIIPI